MIFFFKRKQKKMEVARPAGDDAFVAVAAIDRQAAQ